MTTVHSRTITVEGLELHYLEAGEGPPVLMLAALGAGGLWTAIALWRGNLLAATVCHLVWDFLVFWLAPYA